MSGLWGQTVYTCVLSCVRLFVTPWTVTLEAPLSMEFSREDYQRGLPFPPPGDLPDPGIEPASLASPALAGGFFTNYTIWEVPMGSNRPSSNPTLTSH